MSAEEIEISKKVWLRRIQGDVVKKLKDNEVAKKDSEISQLGLTIDKEDIVHCHGRLNNTDMFNEEAIFPIYLPSKSYWTLLLIKDYHVRCCIQVLPTRYHR